MAEAVIMPKTGMAMTEGSITEWLVKEGDVVTAGDPVVEIETDKSSMEVVSDCDGTVLRLIYEEGTTVPVTRPIAWIGKPGEAIPQDVQAPAAAGPAEAVKADVSVVSETRQDIAGTGGTLRATPAARRAAGELGVKLEQVVPTGRHGEIREADVLSTGRAAGESRATPLARRMADSAGIDLKEISGSGYRGKVFAADVESAGPGKADAAAGDIRVPLTRIQKITGARMLRSHLEIPAVSMDTHADVTELLRVRQELNDTLNCRITINDFVLKAAAIALSENPRMNSVLDGDDLIFKSSINLGMAVATDKGLLVPVIRNADTMTLRALSLKAAEMAGKSREGKLTPEEMEGGTFTVSNIGKFGVTFFTPIINQPQAAILGVCAVDERLRLVDGQVKSFREMGLSITFDHRIVDGAEASVFFSRVRMLLEHPLSILA